MTDLTRLAEWTVPPDEIDYINHRSTLFYALRSNAGALQLVEGLAGGPEALAAAGLGLAVVDEHTLFRREQRLDAPLTLAGEVIAADAGAIGVHAEMANAATGELAATFRLQVQPQRRPDRAPASIPAAWLEAAAARRIEPPARSHPRSLPLERMGAELGVADFARTGVASHHRREIAAEACDAEGFLAPRRPKLTWTQDYVSRSVMDQVWGCCPGFVWPALEKRALTLRPVRQGDVLESYEALLSVSHKVMHSGLWVFEARSGALVSVTHQVNVFFSLETRRSLDMPLEIRELLDGLAQPELLAPASQAS